VSRLSLVLTAVAALVSAFMHDFTEGVLLLTIGASMGLSAVMLGRWAKKVRGRSERRVHSRVPASDPVVREAVTLLRELLDSAHVDESHGISHVLAVLGHLDRAVASAAKPIGVARVQALRLAALLHDADDKKYFDSSKTCENAARILRDAGADPNVAAEALRCIGWVSCSSNGNSFPAECEEAPELLWPRWADRLEAVGEVGVVRCYQYNKRDGAPLACESTPRPQTAEEALGLATPERFAAYQASGGGSASMLDHYYDKLLPIARPPPSLVRNLYLEREALAGAAPLIDILLEYGRSGVVPVDRIEAMAARLGMPIE